MSDPQKLIEIRWRRPLTADEEAELRLWLADRPEAQAEWELEAGLTEGLNRLPDIDVPSNFTARVLQELERRPVSPRVGRWKWVWRSLVPKAALVAVICGAGLFVSRQHAMARRLEMAQSVAAVSKVSSLPSPEILEDFEVIRQLNFNPPSDEELLALMK